MPANEGADRQPKALCPVHSGQTLLSRLVTHDLMCTAVNLWYDFRSYYGVILFIELPAVLYRVRM